MTGPNAHQTLVVISQDLLFLKVVECVSLQVVLHSDMNNESLAQQSASEQPCLQENNQTGHWFSGLNACINNPVAFGQQVPEQQLPPLPDCLPLLLRTQSLQPQYRNPSHTTCHLTSSPYSQPTSEHPALQPEYVQQLNTQMSLHSHAYSKPLPNVLLSPLLLQPLNMRWSSVSATHQPVAGPSNSQGRNTTDYYAPELNDNGPEDTNDGEEACPVGDNNPMHPRNNGPHIFYPGMDQDDMLEYVTVDQLRNKLGSLEQNIV